MKWPNMGPLRQSQIELIIRKTMWLRAEISDPEIRDYRLVIEFYTNIKQSLINPSWCCMGILFIDFGVIGNELFIGKEDTPILLEVLEF